MNRSWTFWAQMPPSALQILTQMPMVHLQMSSFDAGESDGIVQVEHVSNEVALQNAVREAQKLMKEKRWLGSRIDHIWRLQDGSCETVRGTIVKEEMIGRRRMYHVKNEGEKEVMKFSGKDLTSFKNKKLLIVL